MVAEFFRAKRACLQSSVRRTLKRKTRRNTLEQLEPRYVLDSTVVFNELMYHPRIEDGPEWIELHNQQGVNIDISNWRLDGGVEFAFPEGTVLPQRGFLVISSDPTNTVVEEGTEILGPYVGSLANNGELIRLLNMNDREMDSIDYTDSFPWPVGPDGSGTTLTKIDLSSTSTEPKNWVSSPQVGGTPGERNFPSEVIVFDTLNLHETGDSASVHLPSSNALGTDWTEVDFVEGAAGEAWTQQSTGIGFFEGELGESYQSSVLTDNPLGYWRFGETNVASPAVNEGTLGATIDGTYGEDAVLGVDSVVGDALDNAIQLTGDASVSQFLTPNFEKVGPDGRTTEFWLVLEEVPTREAPLVGDGEGALDFGLIVTLTDESRIRVRMKTDISFIGFSNYDSERQLEVGEVVHVVANWSATTGESQLFLDGVEVTQVNQSGPKPNSGNAISTDNPLYVGRDRRSSRNAPARIDEVAVYDYLLAPDRIQAHFLAGTPKFSGLYQSEVEGLYETGTSAYIRNRFELPPNLAFEQLTMNVRYDDGFIAYLNGQEVSRRNVTGAGSFDSVADSSREFADARLPEVVDLSDHKDLLQAGANVLAIHALNSSIGDDDFLIEPELFALARELPPVPAPDVVFNEISAASTDTFQVEFKNNSDTDATLDGFILVSASDLPQEYTFGGRTIAPGALLSLTEEDLGFRPNAGDDLYLYNTDKTQLVDARRVTNRLRGRSEAHDGRWLYPDVETFGAANSFDFDTNIVINEIMYTAPIVRGETDFQPEEQWVELYNRGDQSVDLTGWSFVDGIRYDFDPGTTIEPGGFLVISNDAEALAAKYPSSDIVGDFGGRLSRSGERIELEDAFENPVDIVNYRDQGRWDTWADGGGSSIELRDPDADNGQPEAWQASDESDGGQWQTITYRGSGGGTFGPSTYHEFILGLLDAGEVLIDDITVHESPDGINRQLIQNGTFEADALDGGADKWRLLGTHELSQIVPDPDDPTNHVLKLVATGPTEHMHNHAETTLKSGDDFVTLSNSRTYEISFRARWLAGSDLLNSRLYFNRLPQTTALAMPSDWGTPGAQNSRYVENIGPTYTNFSHSPMVPLPGQFVNVTVNVEDADGIENMRLYYTLDGGETNSVAMTTSGDGQYVGQIPGGSAGDVFHFYVEGTDALGATSTFPARGASSRALFVVEDGKGSVLGVNNFRIVMLTADADRFHEETNVMSNARTGATIIYNNSKAYYDVGVRLKGSQRGRNRTVRAGFNVQFDPLDQFRGEHQSVGIDRSGAGDEFNQKEVLVKQTLNHAGGVTDLYDDLIYVVTPREVHTGSALLQMARYNSLFLDTMYDNGSDGDLFKIRINLLPKYNDWRTGRA